MRNNSIVYKNKLLSFGLLVFVSFFSLVGHGQITHLPYSYQFYQKLNKEAYSAPSNFHSSLKPYVIADSSDIGQKYNKLITPKPIDTTKGIIYQLLFNRHLLEQKTADYSIYLDFLPDFQLGHQTSSKASLWLNTRGIQVGGTVGKDFFFYTSLYENQGVLPDYENSYIKATSENSDRNTPGMVPGQAYDRSLPKSDWAYVTALIGYNINKNVSVQMGEDKTFIGDGYRSVLLSDFAAPYPLLRLNVSLCKNVQYTAMWAYLEDQRAKQFNVYGNNRRKWGVFHYVDWNINSKASLGFFNALIAEEATDGGVGHGFDLNYINPLYFSSSLHASSSTVPADHTLLGLNAKFNLLKKTTLYGQILIDQTTQLGFGQRSAFQLGIRGSDLFTAKRLNYLLEYNTAKPFTYSSQYPIVNYTQLSEPLAHPFGANFKEWVALLNYSIGRFDFQGQIDEAKYGLNNSLNYGKNILISNTINLPSSNINITGQGLATTLHYAEGTIAFLLNPKYNLRLEAGLLIREEKNIQTTTKTTQFTFGIRSSFRNLYHDF